MTASVQRRMMSPMKRKTEFEDEKTTVYFQMVLLDQEKMAQSCKQ